MPEVVARIVGDYPEVTASMVGPNKEDGSLRRCQNLAVELGVANRIAFPGSIDKADVPTLLANGDIFLNTSQVDNTPVSVLEAMASGLCVVSTDVGGISYLLEHERDSLLVPPDDPIEMANAVCRILREPRLAKLLSCNARRKVEQFDWSVVLPTWQHVLDSVTALSY